MFSRKICIVGAGYMGQVQALILSTAGHDVVMYDILPERQIIKDIFEYEYQLSLIPYTSGGLPIAEVYILFVPDHAIRVAVHQCRAAHPSAFIIVRSTVKDPGHNGEWQDSLVAVLPEFVRESTNVVEEFDTFLPALGLYDQEYLVEWYDLIDELYPHMNVRAGKVFSAQYAEALKVYTNIWNAYRIVFSNEVGLLLRSKYKEKDINRILKHVMSMFPERYNKTGLPYGGYCLPKEVRGISQRSGLGAYIDNNNNKHKALLATEIRGYANRMSTKNIIIVGRSFTECSRDERGSISMEIAELLRGDGYEVQPLSTCEDNLDPYIERYGADALCVWFHGHEPFIKKFTDAKIPVFNLSKRGG